MQALQSSSIIPDVLDPFEPQGKIQITYRHTPVHLGESVHYDIASVAPHVQWQGDPGKLYTLIMTDPDAPSRRTPRMREWRHWVVINIQGCEINTGNVLTSYNGPTPPVGSGPHRYVLIVCEQAARVAAHMPPDSDRGRWKARDFIRQSHLTPVDATFYFCERY
eukprot:gnl/Trimastix_PCT/3582.p1 GENE.gnl/Trimastix_PCT/3582~~gnl/Trimastix_PCT/3582.p1  ORF type:complete len:164 (+),score=20.79 gnl/Trimastix_PCT/3582:57-548(+)